MTWEEAVDRWHRSESPDPDAPASCDPSPGELRLTGEALLANLMVGVEPPPQEVFDRAIETLFRLALG